MRSDFKDAAEVFRTHGGILRMSQATRAGISRKTLYAMRDAGSLEQLGRGLYRLASLPALGAPDIVIVANRVPHGVVCLISALAFHELTTQVPRAVDIAIPRGSAKPRMDHPPVNVFWFSGAAYEEGIDVRRLDGQEVRVYCPEKSIADAFKFRNRIGLDVALEALRIWRSGRGCKVGRLLGYARICRVESVIRPYLEALM